MLYRALRPDVDFRFVAVDEAGDGYEVVREHGTPDVAGGVVLVNPFAVPDGEDDAFLADWDVAQRGARASSRATSAPASTARPAPPSSASSSSLGGRAR